MMKLDIPGASLFLFISVCVILHGLRSEDSPILLETSLAGDTPREQSPESTEKLDDAVVTSLVVTESLNEIVSPSEVDVQEVVETTSSHTEGSSLVDVHESSAQGETTVSDTIDSPVVDQTINESSSAITTETTDNSATKQAEPPPEVPVTAADRGSHDVQFPDLKSTNEATLTQSGDSLAESEEGKSKPDDSPTEENFATFAEWSAQVRAEEKSKLEQDELSSAQPNAGVAKTTKLNRNNYASSECGAKVVATNPEAENSRNILNDDKDEYMINPCRVKNWFVVELCEPIQIQSLDLASLELFASQPHRFTVYLSDCYPPKEWRVLASFEATDERGVQSFQIQDDIFVKFVKVEMVDHYGEEHYCPVTFFRVYGVALADEDDDSVPTKADDDAGTSEDKPSNLFESAKATVLSLVKKVLKVDGANDTEHGGAGSNVTTANDTSSESNTPNAFTEGGMLPHVPTVTVGDTIGTKVAESGAHDSHLPTSTDHLIVTKLEDHEQPPSSQSAQPAGSRGYSNLRALASSCCSCETRTQYASVEISRVRPVCLYLALILRQHPMSNCTNSFESQHPADESLEIQEKLIDRSKSADHIIDVGPASTGITLESKSSEISSSQSSDVNAGSSSSDVKTPSSVSDLAQPSRAVSITDDLSESDDFDDEPCVSQGILDLEPSSKTCRSLPQSSRPTSVFIEASVESYSSQVRLESSFLEETSMPEISATPILPKESTSNHEVTPPQATIDTRYIKPELPEMTRTSDDSTTDDTEIPVVVATGVTSAVVSSEVKVIKANVTKAGHLDETGANLVRVPVNAVSKRETQIMRLSNRIKVLELNVSLSSRFLEELSQRYRKKSEDLMKMLNSTTSQLVNATKVVSLKEQSQETQMMELEARVDDLTASISHLGKRVDALYVQVNERHITWVVIEVAIASLLLLICLYKQRPVARPIPVQYATHHHATPSHGPATPSRHQRNRSADDVINIPVSSLTKQKRKSSDGCIDNLPSDFHIVQPVDQFITDFGKPPDGLRRKRKRRSKHMMTSSHTDLSNLLPQSSQSDRNHNATPHVDTLQSEFSSAGLLFAADLNYKQKSNESRAVVKKSKSFGAQHAPSSSNVRPQSDHSLLKRSLSHGGGQKRSAFAVVNGGRVGSSKNVASATINSCNLDVLPSLVGVAQNKMRPTVRA